MLNEWIPLHRYKLLSSSDSPESSMSWTHCTHLLGLKRFRAAITAAVILLVLFSLTLFIDLPIRIHIPQHQKSLLPDAEVGVNWTDFAYVQYVTNSNYLCNSLMILESLHRHGAKADRIMMYPEEWHVPEESDGREESRLLAQARDLYQTKLVPIKVQTIARGDPTWQDSYTKLLAFNQTQYRRVISLDSDATVRAHMDELFLIPSSPVAMPRAYWLDQLFLSSQLVVIEPARIEWERMQEYMKKDNSGFDMDILNTVYKDSCIVLPHHRYNMLSAEFRTQDHTKYLGSDEKWNGQQALEEAKFVHFSDWPLPKPWINAGEAAMAKQQPPCKDGEGEPNCTDRDIWLELYREFSERRQRVCGHSYDRRRRLSRSHPSSLVAPKYEPIIV